MFRSTRRTDERRPWLWPPSRRRAGGAWRGVLAGVLALGLSFAGPATAAPAAPVLTEEQGQSQIQTERYTARIAPDGCLESIRLGELELLDAKVHFSRGSYFYPDVGPPARLTDITKEKKGASVRVLARSDQFRGDFEFSQEGIHLTLHNDTEAVTPYYFVLSDRLRVLRDGEGPRRQVEPLRDGVPTPRAAHGQGRDLWLTYEDGSRVRVQASALKYWGPWVGRQVLELSLPPKATEKLSLSFDRDPEGAPASVTPTPVAPVPAAPAPATAPAPAPAATPAPASGEGAVGTEGESPTGGGCGACRAGAGPSASSHETSAAGTLLVLALLAALASLRRRGARTARS